MALIVADAPSYPADGFRVPRLNPKKKRALKGAFLLED
jgi:hypothetical protein